VFLGDWLHAQGKQINRDVYHLAYAAFEAISENCKDFIVIPGNHDIFGSRIGVLRPLRKIAHIIDKPEIIEIGEDNFYCIPYTEDREQFRGMLNYLGGREGSKILCSHIGVRGAVAGLVEYMVKEPILPQDILDVVDIAILGHHHKHQTIANHIHYVGSPYQIDFSEMGIAKGYVRWTDHVEFCVLDGPQFWVVIIKSPEDLEKFRENQRDDHYYKLIIKTKKVTDKGLNFGPNIVVEKDIKRRTTPRVQARVDDAESLINYYVENTQTDLDKDIIKKKAIEMYQKRREEV